MKPLDLLQELVSIPGPPGQESRVREAVERHVQALGYQCKVDAKGNLLVPLSQNHPKVVVTAHLDEIAMIVQRIEPDGQLMVGALGGLYPWKLGEGPVQLLAREPIDGVLSFGSIHTADPKSTVRQANKEAIDWNKTRVFTGLTVEQAKKAGVRPGTRVVVHPSRRALHRVGEFISGYFLDDRADLVAWLLALEMLQGQVADVLFLASVAEEVGGEGALYALQHCRPDVCVALELGPSVDDAPIELSDQPTLWAADSYSNMLAADGDLVAGLGNELGLSLQFQALSRGGSDASCAASHGLCGRPITLGIPMENSHGFEIIHPGAMENLAKLTVALVQKLST